jgi:hypothetical protein
MPNRFANGANISSVSFAKHCCLTLGKESNVLMLSSLSASLMSTALASTVARNTVRSLSASSLPLAVLFRRASLLKRLRLETCRENTTKLFLSQSSVVGLNDLNLKPTKKRQPSNCVVNSVSSTSLKKQVKTSQAMKVSCKYKILTQIFYRKRDPLAEQTIYET